ncbi:deoxyribose-phosphate aldolase [Diplogelasinospora grovesii]|uniref:deoxyribose-phosphate aldolase n=1 Tax=Diplogelasinospora grovesii TaxID=303347 RepID=A0AAN6S225_9PEZI|nr:deoxyribose-phosphate aldolase [Diplogelasinospora grovesii]
MDLTPGRNMYNSFRLRPTPVPTLPKMAEPTSIKVTIRDIAKQIDHSLLHPTMTDKEIEDGLEIARKYNVAAACVKPYSIKRARRALEDTDVLTCAVIGFPHGNSTTSCKNEEARHAVLDGAHEVDMVVNVGKVLGGDWNYVHHEIETINRTVITTPVGMGGGTAILKVIFENDYLQNHHIIKLCEICTRIGVAFVKTSTGYGFVKGEDGWYTYKGATPAHLKLMRQVCGPNIKIKAAGGVRTLDDVLYVMGLGTSRIGATATVAIIEEALKRGINDVPMEVAIEVPGGQQIHASY